MAIDETVKRRRIHKTADGKSWLLVESHQDSNAEQVFCREVEKGYLKGARVVKRDELKETKQSTPPFVSDRFLMERIGL